MNRFDREVMDLGFGLYREEKCERICALARTFGINPVDFNASEMGREICSIGSANQDLLHYTMKKGAADSLGISVPQLSNMIRIGHSLTKYFQWGTAFTNGELYPTCGPEFVSPDDEVEFVLPVFGEDNSAVYSDFPVFKYRMSSECPESDWSRNMGVIDAIDHVLDFLDDEEITDEVADAVFIAFAESIGENCIHPSMLDVCVRILRRVWAA